MSAHGARKTSRAAFCLLLALATSGALAQPSAPPERMQVLAGRIPLADGVLRTVILTTDGVSGMEKHCGPGWSYALIQAHVPAAGRGLLTNPTGCWAATSSDPKTAVVTLRYLEPPTFSAREVRVDLDLMQRSWYDPGADRLVPVLGEQLRR